MNRRRLLDLLIKGGGLLTAGVLLVPAVLTAVSPALRRRFDPVWRPVTPLNGQPQFDNFPVGQVTEGQYEAPRDPWERAVHRKTVYVWRPTEEEVVVYSRNCTDLSCPVNWDAGSQCFFCPCHGGIFNKEGTPMAGPPAEPLFRYAVRIRDDILEIDTRSVPPMA